MLASPFGKKCRQSLVMEKEWWPILLVFVDHLENPEHRHGKVCIIHFYLTSLDICILADVYPWNILISIQLKFVCGVSGNSLGYYICGISWGVPKWDYNLNYKEDKQLYSNSPNNLSYSKLAVFNHNVCAIYVYTKTKK